MAETQHELSESELAALNYRTRVEEALKRHELRVNDLEVATEAVKAAKCAIKQTAQYRELERALREAGYDVIVFIASREEDESRITCGNAVLSDRGQ